MSQCRRITAGDEDQLDALAKQVLGSFAVNPDQYEVVVTAIGRDANNRAFSWPMRTPAPTCVFTRSASRSYCDSAEVRGGEPSPVHGAAAAAAALGCRDAAVRERTVS